MGLSLCFSPPSYQCAQRYSYHHVCAQKMDILPVDICQCLREIAVKRRRNVLTLQFMQKHPADLHCNCLSKTGRRYCFWEFLLEMLKLSMRLLQYVPRASLVPLIHRLGAIAFCFCTPRISTFFFVPPPTPNPNQCLSARFRLQFKGWPTPHRRGVVPQRHTHIQHPLGGYKAEAPGNSAQNHP